MNDWWPRATGLRREIRDPRPGPGSSRTSRRRPTAGRPPARPGHQQRRRTHRAGTAAHRDRAGCAAGDPDGLAVRDEGRHHLAARLEAQRLEDLRGQAGRQPGPRRADRRTARRAFRRVPLRPRPPGRRRPAQRLRRPRGQPGGDRPGAREQRTGLPAAAAVAGHPEKTDRPARAKSPKRSGGSSSRTIKAKFPGRCLCGRPYAAGEPIAKNAQGWGHPECRTEAAG